MGVKLNLDRMSTAIKLAIPVDQVRIKVLLKISKSKKIYSIWLYIQTTIVCKMNQKSPQTMDAASIYSVSLIHMQRFNFRN